MTVSWVCFVKGVDPGSDSDPGCERLGPEVLLVVVFLECVRGTVSSIRIYDTTGDGGTCSTERDDELNLLWAQDRGTSAGGRVGCRAV